MKSLPLKAQVYILILFLIFGIVLLFSFHKLFFELPPARLPEIFLQIVIFGLSIFLADLYPIRFLTEGNAEVTISCAFKTTVAIVFVQYSPEVAVLVTLLGTLSAEFMMRRTWYKALFNVSQMTLTSAAMSLAYAQLYDGVAMPFNSLQNTAAMGAMVLTYVLVNTVLVTIVVSFTRQASFLHVWKANFLDVIWNNLTIIPIGAVLAALWLWQPWSVFALILPLIVVRRSFEFIVQLQDQTKETLVHIADAIDQRDPSTYQHSQRVAQIAEAIAQELGLPDEEVDTIRTAARLHDLGKIGMSNTLLFKPGKFDEDELAEFRRHSAIGAELVQRFRLFTEGQHLILYHHERYDGKGYPTGLAGEAIPLGSRILAVADSFDAMTSWRVYRDPMSLDEATGEVVANKGTQFDPGVVDAFLKVVEHQDSRVALPLYSGELAQ